MKTQMPTISGKSAGPAPQETPSKPPLPRRLPPLPPTTTFAASHRATLQRVWVADDPEGTRRRPGRLLEQDLELASRTADQVSAAAGHQGAL